MSLINITLIVYVIASIAYITREIWRSAVTKWISLGIFILVFWLLISFGIVNFTFVGLNYLPSAADSEHIYGSK